MRGQAAGMKNSRIALRAPFRFERRWEQQSITRVLCVVSRQIGLLSLLIPSHSTIHCECRCCCTARECSDQPYALRSCSSAHSNVPCTPAPLVPHDCWLLLRRPAPPPRPYHPPRLFGPHLQAPLYRPLPLPPTEPRRSLTRRPPVRPPPSPMLATTVARASGCSPSSPRRPLS